MHAVMDDGAWIAYERAGSGPVVLLLHGLADDRTLWRHQVPALAKRFTVVALDVRGHGRSSKRPVPAEMSRLEDDVLAVADAVGAERVGLVGLSMGGGIAQNVVVRAPDRVWALGLVSTSSWFPPSTRQRFLDRAALAERDGMAAVAEGMARRWFTPAWIDAHPDRFERTVETVAANDPVAFAAASRVNAQRDWTERLAEIRCPVVYIGGTEDPADAVANAAVYRERIAHAETHLIEGASHLVPVERPAQVTSVLMRAFSAAAGL